MAFALARQGANVVSADISGERAPDAASQVREATGVRTLGVETDVSDGGSGVDPLSLQAQIDGDFVPVSYAAGLARLPVAGLAGGRHALTFTASDYQETKNMENVGPILPNTRFVAVTVVVR